MRPAKDYIIFPLDVPSLNEAKEYVRLLSDQVGMFKVGLELFIRSGPEIIMFIKSFGQAGVFLDLKLHDIPATVHRAMDGIADFGIRLATVHCGESQKMLEAAVKGSRGIVGVLGVTVLTSVSQEDIRAAGFRDDLASDMPQFVLKRAEMAHAAGCAGVVCSGHEVLPIKRRFGPGFIVVTPGIRPLWDCTQNDDQKRIVTPVQAVKNGADYLVIGRPIRDAKDPRQAAIQIAEELHEQI